MKKLFIISSIIILIICINKSDTIKIPSDSIRIRVIANSNSIDDQLLKIKVKTKLEEELYKDFDNIETLNEARNTINKNLSNINNLVSNTYGSNDYEINFGQNYFPEKEMYGVKYKAGNYESLVIKLGKGQGENWWCVLFPPLCMINTKSNDTNNVEYKSKVLEILKAYE